MTWFYIGCAALLIATLMLRLPSKLRAGLFAAMIMAALTGGQSPRVVEHIAIPIVALN